MGNLIYLLNLRNVIEVIMKEPVRADLVRGVQSQTRPQVNTLEIREQVALATIDIDWMIDTVWGYVNGENRQESPELKSISPASSYRKFVEEHELLGIERTLLAGTMAFTWKHKDFLKRLQEGAEAKEVQLRFRRLEQVGIVYDLQKNKIALTPQAIARIMANDDAEIAEENLYVMENSMLLREGVIIAEATSG